MYVACSCGSRHWGHLGAAGLLLTDPERTGVVLQLRSRYVHQGGTWSVPGGALDPHETPADAALREAHEEAGIDPAAVTLRGTILGTDHPEWTYTYVLAEVERPAVAELDPAGSADWEAVSTRWVDLGRVPGLNLHPAMRASWDRLTAGWGEFPRPTAAAHLSP